MKNSPSRSWLLTPKELVIVGVIGVLTSLVDHELEQFLLPYFANLQNQIHLFDYTGGPVVGDLLLVWLQYGGVLAAFLIRKPGAGTIAMTVNGFIQVYVNGIHQPHLLYGVTGLGADLVFAVFRYRRYDLWVAGLAGTASEVFWYPIVYLTHGVYLYPVTLIITDLVVRIFASFVGNGLLGAVIGFIILSLFSSAKARAPKNGFGSAEHLNVERTI
ncbi:MAG: ECF transporter S component [Thaumarchaeota archaeon]|nr:ECF transporter S component [Nitrososphaerota archaeon]